MGAPALVDRVAEHIPRAGLAQLVAVVEEYKRRAAAGHRAPRELKIVLELNEETGAVEALVVPRRYGRD